MSITIDQETGVTTDWLEGWASGAHEYDPFGARMIEKACDMLREERLKRIAAQNALKPFAQAGLCKAMAGNVEGDDSPVFGRDRALLRLGDFRNARRELGLPDV